MNEFGIDPHILKELKTTKMPFGKYKGTVICNIPSHYIEWYYSKGFPAGRLGMLLHTMYEIRINGLEALLRRIK